MRIGFNALGLNPAHNGGAESVFMNLLKGFIIYGGNDQLIVFCYPKMEDRIKTLYPSVQCVVVDIAGKESLSRFDMLKIQTNVFHKMYKSHNLDVLLFANPDVGLFKYNVPAVVIPHDIQFVSRPEINRNRIQYYKNYYSYKLPFKIVDRIICISDIDKQEIEKCFPFASRKTIRIYDPIDVSKEDIKIHPKKEDFILAVNIQYPHKNIETLIRAFAIICKQRTDLSLKLVGAKNSHTQSLEELVKSLDIADKVEFLGFVSREYLDELWESASLYVNPSLYEGFGMTSVESILHGAPTLLSDIPVNHEVTDDLCEFFSDIKNPQTLSEAIENMLAITYNEQESKEKAHKLVEKYSLHNISKQYLDLLNEVGGNKCH